MNNAATPANPESPPTATTPSIVQPLLATPAATLPDWPPLLTFLLLAWLGVAWLVAVILYFATFPEKIQWLETHIWEKMQSRRGVGRNSASAPQTPDHQRQDHPHPSTSADAQNAAQATGLGIAFASLPTHNPRLRKQRSFDQIFLASGPSSPSRNETNSTLTAPLPSSKSFEPSTPTPKLTVGSSPLDAEHVRIRRRRVDLESGLQSRSWVPGSFEVDGRDVWVREEGWRGREKGGGLSAVLESVNAGIAFVADKVARLASDHVRDGAEVGFLLPVRNGEREGREGAGVGVGLGVV